jgi:hypothetical protein
MDTHIQPGAMELSEGESGAPAHLPLSRLLALLLEQQRPHALRPIYGLLRGLLGRSRCLLGRSLFFGARAERSSSLSTRAT